LFDFVPKMTSTVKNEHPCESCGTGDEATYSPKVIFLFRPCRHLRSLTGRLRTALSVSLTERLAFHYKERGSFKTPKDICRIVANSVTTKIMCRLIACCCLGIFLLLPVEAQQYTQEDLTLFRNFLQYAKDGNNDVIRIARFFAGTPYVGGTLEGDSTERLRINLRELDCMTLTENVIALCLLLQGDEHTFENFCSILQRIRYRNGTLDGYLSRLHYSSEWLHDNRHKGLLELPVLPACLDYVPNVSYMSAHCGMYPALSAHPEWCAGMKSIEQQINKLKFCRIPKQQLESLGNAVQNGDIILITTNISGLDISHMGFALLQNGKTYLLHASSEAKKVVVSKETLYEYLARHKSHSGIIVARIMRQAN
jgi:hypothetical protein